jgi:hypothetical protein
MDELTLLRDLDADTPPLTSRDRLAARARLEREIARAPAPSPLVRETVEVGPAAADRATVWESVVERLGDYEPPGRRPPLESPRRGLRDLRRLHQPRSEGVGLAEAVALAVLAVSPAATVLPLLPRGDEPVHPQAAEPGRELLPPASAHEAAAVLNATATRARSALPTVGLGDYLFTRSVQTVPGEGAISVDIDSWTATDGSARMVSREHLPVVVERVSAAGGAVKLAGDLFPARPSDEDDAIEPGARLEIEEMRGATAVVSETSREPEVTTERYEAGSAVRLITVNGVEQRVLPPQLSPDWRYVVPGDDVVSLPVERDALLASLREGAEHAVRLYQRPRPKGYYPRVDRRYELLGHDLLVVKTATALLIEAPISPDQRAALMSLLADVADWYQPGASAEPIQIRLGRTKDALGRSGTEVVATQLTDGARVEGVLFDLVLDPGGGQVLEVRYHEHDPPAEPIRLTVVAQRVVDSINGQRRPPHA